MAQRFCFKLDQLESEQEKRVALLAERLAVQESQVRRRQGKCNALEKWIEQEHKRQRFIINKRMQDDIDEIVQAHFGYKKKI